MYDVCDVCMMFDVCMTFVCMYDVCMMFDVCMYDARCMMFDVCMFNV
jgi:hypothetical protein